VKQDDVKAVSYVWQRHSFTGPFRPRSKVVRSFLLMVPWINLLALGGLLWLFSGQTLVQPGRVVVLPQGVAEEGLSMQVPAAVIKPLLAPGREGVTVLLLDDGRYCSDRPSELDALAHAYPGHELNLIVDVSVPYGDTMLWIERLRACGVSRVNLVTVADTSELDGGEKH
jgi:hypothetical protein